MAVYEPALVYARPVAVGGSGYCAARFASYDPDSGSYLGCDSFRHLCLKGSGLRMRAPIAMRPGPFCSRSPTTRTSAPFHREVFTT